MAQVTKRRTYSTGNQLTASNYNDDRDEIIAGVNSVENAQVAADADIEESKLLFDTTTGHDHDGSDSKKVLVTNLDVTGLSAGQVVKVNSGGTALEGGGAGRAFAWAFNRPVSTGNEQGAKYIVPQDMTVNKLWYKTDSGTATIRIQANTTDIDSSASVTSSVGSTTSLDSTTLTAGQVLTLDITAASSCVGLYVTLEATQN